PLTDWRPAAATSWSWPRPCRRRAIPTSSPSATARRVPGPKPAQARWYRRAQAARQQALLLIKSMQARLDGKPLPTYHFRDLGSLVSLSELSAVGSLM